MVSFTALQMALTVAQRAAAGPFLLWQLIHIKMTLPKVVNSFSNAGSAGASGAQALSP